MVFKVERVSTMLSSEKPPCEEAKKQIKVFDFHGNINALTEWTLKITSLTQLMDFIQKYGDIIIEKPIGEAEMPTLTIYDDYIE